MSFGFSAGDFIAALSLVGTVINALRETGGSKSEYQELVRELYSLETALLRVKQLELEEEQRSEYLSLRYAAAQCQQTIDGFWKTTQKYQKHLKHEGSGSHAKDCWMKIKWNLCKKDDLVRFKGDVTAHVQSIHILLTALQMNQLKLDDGKRTREHRTLAGEIQQLTSRYLGKLESVKSNISEGVSVGLQILEHTVTILRTNVQIFQTVTTVLNIITRIPNQIDRQQPVYMIDALGRATPFHLEFIRSSEAFKAVLKINFEKIPSGQRKIEEGEFTIQEIATKRQIEYSKDWEQCFAPGQRVEMRMIFHRSSRKRKSCPTCRSGYVEPEDGNVECAHCGLSFSRIVEIKDPPSTPDQAPTKRLVRDHASVAGYGDEAHCTVLGPRLPPRTAFDETEHIKHYRRVHILERKKRKIWHDESGVEVLPISLLPEPAPSDLPGEKNATTRQPTNTNPAPRAPCIDDMGGSLDPETVSQILEMDEEDDLELQFSRSILLDGLQELEQSLKTLEELILQEKIDMIHQYAHFMRGTCSTTGYIRLRDALHQIYKLTNTSWCGSPPPEEREDDVMGKVREQFEIVKQDFPRVKKRMKEFYRVVDSEEQDVGDPENS